MGTSNAEELKHAGQAALRLGRFAEAEQLLGQALASGPATTELLFLFGTSLAQSGKPGEAVRILTAALSAAPADPAIIGNLAMALRQAGRLDEAASHLKRGLAANPKSPELLAAMGQVLRAQGHAGQAAECASLALRLKPDFAEALSLAGLLLLESGKPKGAANYFERILAARPDPAAALGLARARRGLDDFAGAAEVLRRAIEGAPQSQLPALHVGLAEVLLAQGDFAEGAKEYEWRWQALSLPNLPAPLWTGAVLGPDKTLLLWCDGGAADAIQYIRLAPALHAFAGRVVLSCPQHLAWLLASAPGIDQVIVSGAALPAFDAHLPLGSLIHRLGVPGDAVPAATPYLAADPARAGRYAALFDGAGFKVGLAWRGETGTRAPALADLAPLFEIPGIRFFALDAEPPAAFKDRLTDLSPCLGELADAAAVIGKLDLVISADNAVAHLAGALNRPAWVMLPADAHWRWRGRRTDSPWYPSLLLYRETEGGWRGVAQELANSLAIFGAGLGQPAPAPLPAAPPAPAVDLARQAMFAPFLAGPGLKIGLALAGEAPLLSDLAPVFAQKGLRFFALDRRTAVQTGRGPLAGAISDLAFCETAPADAAAIVSQLDLVIGGDNALTSLADRLGVPAWVLAPEAAGQPQAARAATTTLFRRAYGADWSDAIERLVLTLAAALAPQRAAG